MRVKIKHGHQHYDSLILRTQHVFPPWLSDLCLILWSTSISQSRVPVSHTQGPITLTSPPGLLHRCVALFNLSETTTPMIPWAL